MQHLPERNRKGIHRRRQLTDLTPAPGITLDHIVFAQVEVLDLLNLFDHCFERFQIDRDHRP